jgi:uncharacterized membrane protein YraQ (UPF0718 family)
MSPENLGGRDNWLAVPRAVLFGVPLSSYATGVIPVAKAMLGRGVTIGTAVAFIMSIAAPSPPEEKPRPVVRFMSMIGG